MHRAILLVPLLSSGCVIFGMPNLEGSWLFKIDRNGNTTGSCVDPSGDTTAVSTFVGPEQVLVDIYKAKDGTFVVPVEAYMVGDWNSEKVFQAEWTQQDIVQTDSMTTDDSTRYWMTGTWVEGVLQGRLGQDDVTSVTTGGSTTITDCYSTWGYTAVEITSPENAYVED